MLFQEFSPHNAFHYKAGPECLQEAFHLRTGCLFHPPILLSLDALTPWTIKFCSGLVTSPETLLFSCHLHSSVYITDGASRANALVNLGKVYSFISYKILVGVYGIQQLWVICCFGNDWL